MFVTEWWNSSPTVLCPSIVPDHVYHWLLRAIGPLHGWPHSAQHVWFSSFTSQKLLVYFYPGVLQDDESLFIPLLLKMTKGQIFLRLLSSSSKELVFDNNGNSYPWDISSSFYWHLTLSSVSYLLCAKQHVGCWDTCKESISQLRIVYWF